VQILELTQTTIQSALTDLIRDDWHDPRGYDAAVNRKGLQARYRIADRHLDRHWPNFYVEADRPAH
jgi:hypothetical protein